MCVAIDQPTTRRLNTSNTTAKNNTVYVERGDKPVIVSNGNTDARSLYSQTEFFGTARVCSHFRLQAPECVADASRLIEHVVSFADGALYDDAAALSARFG